MRSVYPHSSDERTRTDDNCVESDVAEKPDSIVEVPGDSAEQLSDNPQPVGTIVGHVNEQIEMEEREEGISKWLHRYN